MTGAAPWPAPAWTAEEAAAYLTASGIPVTAGQLYGIIVRLPRFPRAGKARSGPRGGRGKDLYPVEATMELHSCLARWLM